MSKNNVLIASENASVLDMSMLFAFVLSDKINNYNFVVDSTCENASSMRDDYLHVYRHDTTNVSNKAHNNVFQCYLKHRKASVYVLCNKTNFEAFTCDIKHDKQYKNNSLIRYIVSYDNFIAFMHELIAFDNARSVTTATKDVIEAVK